MIHTIYSSHNYERIDDDNDAAFYSIPRLVVHIDQGAVATIGDVLSTLVPTGSEILDLMSSWRSHLPAGLKPARVAGLGMNGTEMQENDQLDSWILHDLNAHPQLPFANESFDAVVNTVSVQYLTQPVEVFRDVCRVLRPGGRFVVIFSNRMFATKAVRIWRESSEPERITLVRRYFEEAGGYTGLQAMQRNTPRVKSSSRLSWLGLSGDPVYIVSAIRA